MKIFKIPIFISHKNIKNIKIMKKTFEFLCKDNFTNTLQKFKCFFHTFYIFNVFYGK